MLRPLELNDLDDIIRIAKLKPRSGGTKPPDDDKLVSSYSRYLENNGLLHCYGYFEDNMLISYIGFGLHENNSRGKFWYASFFHTSKFHNIFSFENPETTELLVKGYEVAENAGHYEYYYSIAQRLEKVYERQWTKNKSMALGRYDLETLAIVPANTISDVELYRKLLGEEPKPNDMAIKKRVLRTEYRKAK